MNKFENELILCIVNSGFSETVMAAATGAGAKGGTVINARGTANKEAEKFFHITIHPDKEIVFILVPVSIKDNVLHALYKNVGLDTEGQGIAFSLPVDSVVGLSDANLKKSVEKLEKEAEDNTNPPKTES